MLLYGYIYETTNNVNGMKYIGMHKSETFDENYKGSGILITRALKKYGSKNFTCRILKECLTREELYNSEKEIILEFDAVNSDKYYNIAPGGQGGDLLADLPLEVQTELRSKQLEHLTTKGRIWITNGVEERMIYPEELNRFIEMGFTKGKIPFTEEHKKRISRPGINVGRRWHKSQESKDKVRGKNNPMWNSTFRWVNDGVRNYRWKLDKEIPYGYVFGKIRRTS